MFTNTITRVMLVSTLFIARQASTHDFTGQLYEASTGTADRPTLKGYITSFPVESAEHREARHKQIAERRSRPVVIVHRGAWAFVPENTMEAYAAAMDYGADGCEIDIRRTADGVLVMFHDDGMDRMTGGLGRINQHNYTELLAVEFRPRYRPKPDTRIPTFAAVLELARQRAMLLHLDVKEPGLEDDIAALLDAADMWDHIVEINEWNAKALRKHPNFHRLVYKPFGWQEGRMDMSPRMVREGLAKSGDMIMVDDPRVVARELKRQVRRVPLSNNLYAPLPRDIAAPTSPVDSFSPVAQLRLLANRVDSRSVDALGKLLAGGLSDRTDLKDDGPLQQKRARRILERAWAARKLGQLKDQSPRSVQRLEDLVTHRSLHRDWAYNGLDGAMAVRALGVLGKTESVPFLVQTFLSVDAELKKLVASPADYPYAWADYRMKREIICALGELPCAASKDFLNEYLAMDKEAASKFAPLLFEEATRAMLRQTVTAEELEGLLRSRHSAVRGTAILVCLDDPEPAVRSSANHIPSEAETPGVKPKVNRASLLYKTVPWTQELPRRVAIPTAPPLEGSTEDPPARQDRYAR